MADSASDPQRTFKKVCAQIDAAGGYVIPKTPREVSAAGKGHPPVSVIAVPDESTPGGLESLCKVELAAKAPWITTCVNTNLSCGDCTALKWSPEKRDKALFHAMVAALWEADPGRALSMAFKEPPSPMITVEAACFDGLVQWLKDFCNAVSAI